MAETADKRSKSDPAGLEARDLNLARALRDAIAEISTTVANSAP
jgi:hypothetical protein